MQQRAGNGEHSGNCSTQDDLDSDASFTHVQEFIDPTSGTGVEEGLGDLRQVVGNVDRISHPLSVVRRPSPGTEARNPTPNER